MIPDGLPTLKSGGHFDAEHGTCVMEYVSMIMGFEFTQAPVCTDDVLVKCAWQANDSMTDSGRQRLLLLVPRLMSSPDLVPRCVWADDHPAFRVWAREHHARRAERNERFNSAWNSAFAGMDTAAGVHSYDEAADPAAYAVPTLTVDEANRRIDGRKVFLYCGIESQDDVLFNALTAVLDEYDRIRKDWHLDAASCPVQVPQAIAQLVSEG